MFIVLSFLGGILLGSFYFFGLWWTVNRVSGIAKPHFLVIISFIVRSAVVVVGFYLLLVTSWSYLLSALVGFIVARTVIAYQFSPIRK